jgi:hypothetical protein
MRQQQGVKPRMIDGSPTFFTTELSDTPQPDRDARLSKERIAELHPEYFTEEIISQSARVDVLDRPTIEETQSEMNAALATHPLADLRAD